MTLRGSSTLELVLLAGALAVPSLMLLACLSRQVRSRMLSFAFLGAIPALALAIIGDTGAAIVFDPDRLQVTFLMAADRRLLLGAAALLWTLAGVYAAAYLRDDPRRDRFAVVWLLNLLGCLGVFVSADLASFYLLYALVSLGAYGLVVHDGTPEARRAAIIYVALAVFGEACLVIAFVLLAHAAPGESLLIDRAVDALGTYGRRDQAMVFLLLGFGLKAGLLPLHGWLPLAHPAAPMPASAVLSGAVITTGVLGLLVFLPVADPSAALGNGMGAWGSALLAIGLATALYGVVIGLTQRHPKTVLAYSSVSQMGVVAAIIGGGLAAAGAGAGEAAAYYAANHALVKGALFLGVGVAAIDSPRRPLVLGVLAVTGLSLAGLPPTGGALAKLASKAYVAGPLASPLGVVSAVGTAMLIAHFVRRLLASPGRRSPDRAGALLTWSWAALTVPALVLPWLVALPDGIAATDALRPGALWSGGWPIAVGVGAALLLRRPLDRLPSVPEGDILVPGEQTVRILVERSVALEHVEERLCQWSIAGLLLLLVTIVLGVVALTAVD
ncbi:MAG: hypothetical protein KDA22_07395 [Phycisphaerales bacterium]|nr:hypothetical protein [Phycisphaerales bacterium]